MSAASVAGGWRRRGVYGFNHTAAIRSEAAFGPADSPLPETPPQAHPPPGGRPLTRGAKAPAMARTLKTQAKIPLDLQPWIEARIRFRLSHVHVQMARELGLNPKKLGQLANHDQQPWKLPLQDFIVKLYMKRFGRPRPEITRSIEETAAARQSQEAGKNGRQSRRIAAIRPGCVW